MPLIKSKRPMAKKPEAEESDMPAAKPSLAMAVAMRRKAKKMADGGQVVDPDSSMGKGMKSIRDAFNPPEPKPSPEPKRMADGGMVDLEENAEEAGSTPYDDMNAEAGMKELYDDSQLSAQPEDSNEHGDDIEADAHDMVSAIRRKILAKMGR
jgi:hypothetical protein